MYVIPSATSLPPAFWLWPLPLVVPSPTVLVPVNEQQVHIKGLHLWGGYMYVWEMHVLLGGSIGRVKFVQLIITFLRSSSSLFFLSSSAFHLASSS